MSVDLRKVKKLIELVEESGISELEVRDGDETIRIARQLGQPAVVATPTAQSQAAHAPAGAGSAAPAAAAGFQVRSPMAGTFYSAPTPDAEPFVVPGQSVSAGDVLCIVESMKMMNEIKAERGGVCVGVQAENGEAIGSGQLLFRFE